MSNLFFLMKGILDIGILVIGIYLEFGAWYLVIRFGKCDFSDFVLEMTYW
jgi:hypothetical protein